MGRAEADAVQILMQLPTDTAPGERAAVRPVASVPTAALAGTVAGAAALAISELLAGLVAGAPSLVVEVGAFVIGLQPPGAKQLVVDIFGTNDKLALNVLVALIAVGLAAVLGILARRRQGLARLGYAAIGLAVFLVSLPDPLVDPLLALLTCSVAVGVAIFTLQRLLAIATPAAARAEMPDWSRRRFLGTSLGVGAAAIGGGVVGRLLLDRQRLEAPPGALSLPPVAAPTLQSSASLQVPGVTPIVMPNDRFYRIDTQLLTPRLDARTWKLRIHGLVDREVTLSYADLLAMPMQQQYVTIACVSNEVGGDLVGNALWGGVRLQRILDLAGVRQGASQIVGRAFDGWTCGFPTLWLTDEGKEALLAVRMNGAPLPAAHGFPARLIVPGLYGYVSATKWITEIEVTTLEAFDAYWVPLGWAKYGPIKTQSRIDTPRRGAQLPIGRVAVAGVAWAPERGIAAVEVQVDGGPWTPARLSTPISRATWVQWLYLWQAAAGSHVLRVRATDGTGVVQTAAVQPPAPSGATGYHTISVSVG